MPKLNFENMFNHRTLLHNNNNNNKNYDSKFSIQEDIFNKKKYITIFQVVKKCCFSKNL